MHTGSDHLPSCVPSLFMVRYLLIVAPLVIARSAPCCPPPDLLSPRIAPGSPLSRLTRLVQVSLSRSRDMLTHHYHHHHSLADKAQ